LDEKIGNPRESCLGAKIYLINVTSALRFKNNNVGYIYSTKEIRHESFPLEHKYKKQIIAYKKNKHNGYNMLESAPRLK